MPKWLLPFVGGVLVGAIVAPKLRTWFPVLPTVNGR